MCLRGELACGWRVADLANATTRLAPTPAAWADTTLVGKDAIEKNAESVMIFWVIAGALLVVCLTETVVLSLYLRSKQRRATDRHRAWAAVTPDFSEGSQFVAVDGDSCIALRIGAPYSRPATVSKGNPVGRRRG